MDAVFSESDRQVFEYFNGETIVFGDPIAIDNRFFLDLAGEDLEALGQAATSDKPIQRIESDQRYTEAVRAAFKLAPFDEATGKGATDGQARAVWTRYQAWRSDLEKKAASGPSTPPPLGGSPSAPTSPATSGT